MLNSSLQDFFLPINGAIFFITTASQKAPTSNKNHVKQNTEVTQATMSFRNKLDDIQHKVISPNFNLLLYFSTESYIPSYHSHSNIYLFSYCRKHYPYPLKGCLVSVHHFLIFFQKRNNN